MDATGHQSAQLSSELDSDMAKNTNPENWVLPRVFQGWLSMGSIYNSKLCQWAY